MYIYIYIYRNTLDIPWPVLRHFELDFLVFYDMSAYKKRFQGKKIGKKKIRKSLVLVSRQKENNLYILVSFFLGTNRKSS